MSQKGRLAERVLAASKAARIAKASRLGIIASALLTFMIFSISYYGQQVGNFTVTLARDAGDFGMTMFENIDTPVYVTRIIADQVVEANGMTAYCGTEYTEFPVGDEVCMPSDAELSSVEGANNGLNYLVYTFYIQNVGKYDVDLQATINLISATKGAEEAVRVRIIIDDVGNTYAKPQSEIGESPGALEPLTEAFLGITTVMDRTFVMFSTQRVMKITIIMWYEGEDANHNPSIHSGGVKFEMKFTVTKVYNDELL